MTTGLSCGRIATYCNKLTKEDYMVIEMIEVMLPRTSITIDEDDGVVYVNGSPLT